MNSCGDQCRRYGHAAPHGDHGGFTIVELLVVFAILALLIALLMPGLNRARAAAKRAGCASNLKQLALAWTAYLDANDGYFLKGVDANVIYGGQQGKGTPRAGRIEVAADQWTDPVPKPLNPYLGIDQVAFEGAEVFRCPADEGCIRGVPPVAPSYFEYWGTSYETNIYLVGQNKYQPYDPCVEPLTALNSRLRKLNRAQVNSAGKVILMGDSGWVAAYNPRNKMEVQWHGRQPPHLWFNVAFLDAHVEFMAIHKGLLETSNYSVMPFKDLQSAVQACQEEVGG